MRCGCHIAGGNFPPLPVFKSTTIGNYFSGDNLQNRLGPVDYHVLRGDALIGESVDKPFCIHVWSAGILPPAINRLEWWEIDNADGAVASFGISWTNIMTPADLVIRKFGGVRPLARAIGIDHSSVQRWTKPKSQRGSGGLIPSRHHLAILELAKSRNIDLNAAELICGGGAS